MTQHELPTDPISIRSTSPTTVACVCKTQKLSIWIVQNLVILHKILFLIKIA